MRGTHKNLCLDIFTENFASMQQYREKQGFLRHECPEHQRMLAVLRRAMEQELTPRQLDCVKYYYFQKCTMEDTAGQLGIVASSVSRHLKRARSRLARVMGYAFERLEGCEIES